MYFPPNLMFHVNLYCYLYIFSLSTSLQQYFLQHLNIYLPFYFLVFLLFLCWSALARCCKTHSQYILFNAFYSKRVTKIYNKENHNTRLVFPRIINSLENFAMPSRRGISFHSTDSSQCHAIRCTCFDQFFLFFFPFYYNLMRVAVEINFAWLLYTSFNNCNLNSYGRGSCDVFMTINPLLSSFYFYESCYRYH